MYADEFNGIINGSDRAVHLKASNANLFPTTSISDY